MDDLLAYLAQTPADGRFQQWQITRIHGSANNILYRATGPDGDAAVKFTIRDTRRRAWREFQALTAVWQAGLDVVPQPLWLDEDRYPQPVVAQTWEAGQVTAVPPQTDDEWRQLLAHYVALRAVTPQTTNAPIRKGVINFGSIREGEEAIRQQIAMFPAEARPEILNDLLARLPLPLPEYEPVRPSLCRVDANPLNFLRRPDGWLSVDWENSGWGDPAFEIVDTMTHPQYLSVPESRWEWLAAEYGVVSGDVTAVTRIRATYPLMLIWWVTRLARMLYEVPLGGDERLVERPSNWQADIERKLTLYGERATAVLDNLSH